VMDPLCGGTRGVYWALRGDLGQAWRYNPIAVPLVVGAGLAVLRALVGWTSHRWVTATVTRVAPFIVCGAVVLVLLEINQQAHAPLLMST